MTWLCAARRAAARSSGLSALISICGRAHHVALSGSRGTYQISQPGNCRSSSRRRSPCPTGSLLHPRSATRPSPAMSTRRQTRCGSFRRCQSTTPRQPQLTGACSRKPTRTRQALRRAAPGASHLFAGTASPAPSRPWSATGKRGLSSRCPRPGLAQTSDSFTKARTRLALHDRPAETPRPLFSATQDVHDGDVRGGHVDSGIPGIWRRVGGHGGGDLVTVSRRGEQLAAVSVAGPVAGMAVPGTGGRRSAGRGGHQEAGQAEPAHQRPGHLRPVPEVAPGAVHRGGHGVQRAAQRRPGGL